GVQTDYRVLPGFAEMMMTAAFYGAPSQPMLEATCGWLAARQAALPPAAAKAGVPTSHLATPAFGERAVRFGTEPVLFGIVSEPAGAAEAAPHAIVLLNDGANPHVSSTRLYVELARHWASRGYLVLRMDLEGLGDSATRPGRPVNEVFPPAAMANVREAL